MEQAGSELTSTWNRVRGSRYFYIAIGIALALLCYGRTLNDAFVAEDHMLAVPATWAEMAKYFTTSYLGPEFPDALFYRPLTRVALSAETLIWGDNTLGFRVVNLLIHLINALLVSVLVWHLVTYYRWTAFCNSNQTRGTSRGGPESTIAILAGYVFLVHPAATGAVPWVTAIGDLLCTTFYLLAVVLFMSTRQVAGQSDSTSGFARRHFRYGLSLVAFFIALLFKESATSLPLAIATIAWAGAVDAKVFGRYVKAMRTCLPFYAVLGAYIGTRIGVLGTVGGYDHQGPELLSRLGAPVLENIGSFIATLAVPFLKHESLDPSWTLVFAGALVVVIGGLFYFASGDERRRDIRAHEVRWLVLTTLGLMIVMMVVTSTYPYPPGKTFLILAELHIDWNYLYLPLVGFSIVVGLMFGLASRTPFLSARAGAIVRSVLVVALLFSYCYTSLIRGRAWSEAAEITHELPRQVKGLYPELPDESAVCIVGLPPFGRKGIPVYGLGLDSALLKVYRQNTTIEVVRIVGSPFAVDFPPEQVDRTYFFEWTEGGMTDITDAVRTHHQGL